MDGSVFYLLIFAIFIILIAQFWRRSNEEEENTRKESEERQRIEDERKRTEKRNRLEARKAYVKSIFEKNLVELTNAYSAWKSLEDFDHGYLTFSELNSWIEKYKILFEKINGLEFRDLGFDKDLESTIDSFIKVFELKEKIRLQRNNRFVIEEKKKFKSLFDQIESRCLDEQQREAIIRDEDNNLVVAGAGSGKTTTIVGKLEYINLRYHPDPNSILLISFTRKSALDLKNRIGNLGVTASTFHRFGLEVITEAEGEKPSIYDESNFNTFIRQTFGRLCKDGSYLDKAVVYFSSLMKQTQPLFSFHTQGEHIQYLKDQNIRPYKVLIDKKDNKVTYKREIVKSFEECIIANFLYFNNIEYQYEANYEHKTNDKIYRQYKPDFTINKDGIKIYLEHFAISRDNNVPRFFAVENESYEKAREKYLDGIRWKRDLHKKYATKLIETYSYENTEGILYENLKEKLEESGIRCDPMPVENIWKIINEVAKDEIDAFTTLVGTFIVLMKSNNYTVEKIETNLNKIPINLYGERDKVFLQLIKPISEAYEAMLSERNEIDFSDMINRATAHIYNDKYQRHFTYVVIDEFQDLSIGRYELLKAIKFKNSSCKFYCVGDDWQSIYRFAGSDLNLFTEFEKYFGFSAKSKIETTYRFANPILKISADFIQRNPKQQNKELRTVNEQMSTEFTFVPSRNNEGDDSDAIDRIFNDIASRWHDYNTKKVILLGRYNFDFNRLSNLGVQFDVDEKENIIVFKTNSNTDNKEIELKVPFYSVHRSKGLEADIVIILNCNSGRFGFPSQMSDDPVLRLVLSEEDSFQNSEERRLFYVAMTRAKEHVYFVYDPVFKSTFIGELISESDEEIHYCPRCLTADMMYREGMTNGRKWGFWGCTNFAYGCDYKEWVDMND